MLSWSHLRFRVTYDMIEPTQTFSLHTATISIREKIAAERTFLTAIAISKGKKALRLGQMLEGKRS